MAEVIGLLLAIPPLVEMAWKTGVKLKNLIETMKTAIPTLQNLHEQVMSLRERLEIVRSMERDSVDATVKALIQTFNRAKYAQTLDDIDLLVDQVRKHTDVPLLLKGYWVTQKPKVAVMFKALQEYDNKLVSICTMISAAEVYRQKQIDEALERVAQRFHSPIKLDALSITTDIAHASIDDESIDGETLISDRGSRASSETVPLWPGYTIETGLDPEYTKHRFDASEAAYWGRWQPLLDTLAQAKDRYGEAWGNIVRLRSEDRAFKTSFWTPLHQAAFMGAPVHVIKQLLQHGAMRTMRTRTASHYPFRDLTPAEIATEMGNWEQARELAPTIYTQIPARVLLGVLARFHALIRDDLRDEPYLKYLVLPDLNCLTELEVPEMIFPVQRTREYRYYLDGRELVVSTTSPHGERKYHRLSETGMQEIERAIIFSK